MSTFRMINFKLEHCGRVITDKTPSYEIENFLKAWCIFSSDPGNLVRVAAAGRLLHKVPREEQIAINHAAAIVMSELSHEESEYQVPVPYIIDVFKASDDALRNYIKHVCKDYPYAQIFVDNTTKKVEASWNKSLLRKWFGEPIGLSDYTRRELLYTALQVSKFTAVLRNPNDNSSSEAN